MDIEQPNDSQTEIVSHLLADINRLSQPASPDPDDPFSTVPTEIAGVELTPEERQRFLEAREIEDPRKRMLEGAKMAGIFAARSDEGNLADAFQTSALGALIRNMGAGFFGLGTIASAGVTALSPNIDKMQALAMERAFRSELAKRHPVASITGEILGGLAGGGRSSS